MHRTVAQLLTLLAAILYYGQLAARELCALSIPTASLAYRTCLLQRLLRVINRVKITFYAGYASAFYVSSDNGQTFAAGGSLTGASQINYVTVHPTTAGKVYVSSNSGIYLSTDFGSSFYAA